MSTTTAYEAELAQLDSAIQRHDPSAPGSCEEATRHATLLYRRATLTGSLDALRASAIEIDDAHSRVGPWPDLCLLKAQLDFTMHRFRDVRLDLEMSDGLLNTCRARAMLADLDLEDGNYSAARRAYEILAHDDPSWENFARLAHCKALMGDVGGAEQACAAAEDELTAKEMRSYAWVELQRGLLHLRLGHPDQAGACYQRADRAYSGYWLVQRHFAELLAASGQFEVAASRYEKILVQVARPEMQQALGDLYAGLGITDRAAQWYARALAGYLDSVNRGEVQYIHHLADFYASVRNDGASALRWARADLALRQNHATWTALARALYLSGQPCEAAEAIERALSTQVRDAAIFALAATIYQAVGRAEEGIRCAEEAATISWPSATIHSHH